MQNIRGRARLLARRHARVHFNLGNRIRSSTSQEIFEDDATRDSILGQILVRINHNERELSTCDNRSNELLNIPEDSLTTARIRHEEHLLDDLINFTENPAGDEKKIKNSPDKNKNKWLAKGLKRDLMNWIARNEAELHEIYKLEYRIIKRYAQINHENKHLKRLSDDMKQFTNLIIDNLELPENNSSEVTSVGISSTQSSEEPNIKVISAHNS